jgi:hypothetical protein
MALNLVSTIMQSLLTPDNIAKAASLLGIDRNLAQRVMETAIPAILGIFAHKASTPDGARQVSNALAQQPAAAASGGANPLSSLLSSGDMNALASAIGNSTGINTTAGKSLLGMLGPLVMGSLSQQQRSSGLDPSAMTNLLASQKHDIVSSMPSGLSQMLSGTNLLDHVDAGVRRTADAASTAAGRVAGMGQDAVNRVGQQASYAASASQTWPYWVAGLAALAALSWLLWPHGTQVADRTTSPSETVGTRTTMTSTDITKELTSSVSAARTALLGMADPASARSSLPALQQAANQVDKLNTYAAQLPASERQVIANSLKPTLAALNQLFDKILASPELAAIAKPTIDTLRSRLQALAQV